uniref:Uncharacterized protein n=1 Tax=Melopsittacus undulatus TaxID=13146 RepID=A0A8V5GEP9_MELUD
MGLSPAPTALRRCGSRGQWEELPGGAEPRCVAVHCPSPLEVEHGWVWPRGGSYPPGSKVTFGCPSGFRLRGPQNLTCGEGGRWRGSPPACDDGAGACPALPIPAGGFRSGSGHVIEAVVRFRCRRGLELLGSMERRCREDGTWSGTQPQCRGQGSMGSMGINKGQWDQWGSMGVNGDQWGSMGINGSQWDQWGSMERRCQEDGTWSGTQPQCRGQGSMGSMGSMGINKGQWGSMGINGSQWGSMGINGDQWVSMGSMGINTGQWESMEVNGDQWGSMGSMGSMGINGETVPGGWDMERDPAPVQGSGVNGINGINGDQWGSMGVNGINGHQWASMGINGSQWGSMERRCREDGTWSGTQPQCRGQGSMGSMGINGINNYQWESMASMGINGHQWESMGVNGDQWGSMERRCREDGTWSGTQPQCRGQGSMGSMGSMGINGGQWVSMGVNGINGCQWGSMGVNGDQWESMGVNGINGHQWGSMGVNGINGCQWRSMGVNGDQWESMGVNGINGHQWGSMGVNGDQWESMGINGCQWGSMERRCREDGTWSGTQPQCRDPRVFDTPEEAASGFLASLTQTVEAAEANETRSPTEKRRIRLGSASALNIFLLLDASQSIGAQDFGDARDALRGLVEKIASYGAAPRYGIITFGTEAQVVLSPMDPKAADAAHVEEVLEGLSFKAHALRPGTNPQAALRAVYELLVNVPYPVPIDPYGSQWAPIDLYGLPFISMGSH